MNRFGKWTLGASSLLATVALYGINAHADVKAPIDVPTGSQKAVMTIQQPYADGLQTAKNISSGGGESEQGTSSNLVVNGNDGNIIGLNESKVVDSGISDEQATKYFNNSVNKNVVKTRVGWALQSDVDKYKLAESTEMRLNYNWPDTQTITNDWPAGNLDSRHSSVSLTAKVNASDLRLNQKILVGTLAFGSDVDISNMALYLRWGGKTSQFEIRDSKDQLLARVHFDIQRTGNVIPGSTADSGSIMNFFLVTDQLTDVERTGLVTVSSDFQNIGLGLQNSEVDYHKRSKLEGHYLYFGAGPTLKVMKILVDDSPVRYVNYSDWFNDNWGRIDWGEFGFYDYHFNSATGERVDRPIRLVQKVSGDFLASQYSGSWVDRVAVWYSPEGDDHQWFADNNSNPAIGEWKASFSDVNNIPVIKKADWLSSQQLYDQTLTNQICFSVQNDGSILYSYNLDPNFFSSKYLTTINDRMAAFSKSYNFVKLADTDQRRLYAKNYDLLVNTGINPSIMSVVLHLDYDQNTGGSITIQDVTPGKVGQPNVLAWQPPKKQHNSGSAIAGESATVVLVDDDAHGKTVSSTQTEFAPIGSQVKISPVVPKNYYLVNPSQANFAYRLTDSDNQVVTIHLKHQLRTEDVVVPKDYVVHYKADPKFGDKTLAPDARMQVIYHQKVVTDLVTSEKTYGDLVFDGDKTVKSYPKGALFSQPRSQDFNVISGDWHCSDGVWNSTYVTAPEIDNWNLDDNLNRITGAGVTDHRRIGYTNPLHPNLPWFNNGIPGEIYATPERTVYFKPRQVRVTVNCVDVTGKVIASKDSNVAYEQSVKLSIPDMPANWQLMSGQNTDADYTSEWLTQEVNFIIDHKMQYLPNYEHADAVRRIILNEPGGLTKTLQQRYTFYRDAYKDLVTGDITEGDWNLNEATLPAMIFPRINGYQVKDLAPMVVKPRQMEVVNVNYEPVDNSATVKYVDANDKVVGMQTPSAGEFKLEPPKGYHLKTADSLKLAAGQEYDVLVVADKQIYLANNVPADIQHEPLTKVVTRTIKIVMPNGHIRTIKQLVKFERNMTVDNAGKVEYGDWHAIGHDHFNHVFIPKRVGYRVDGTVNTVADVKASDADSIVTVRYVKL